MKPAVAKAILLFRFVQALSPRLNILALCGVAILLIAILILTLNVRNSPANLEAKRISTSADRETQKAVAGVAASNEQQAQVDSSTSTKKTSGQEPPTGNQTRLSGPPNAIKQNLVITPSNITMPKNGDTVYGEISSPSGGLIAAPLFTSVQGLIVGATDNSPPFPDSPYGKKKWGFFVKVIDYNRAGQGVISVTSSGYSGTIKVAWSPLPNFYVTKGALVRTDAADTITYTANFTLVPNNPYFGSPQITMELYGTNACINTDLTKVITYNGQNDYSLQCVVRRQPVYVPGTGLPPPLPSSLSFMINIYGKLSTGEFIRGPSEQLVYVTSAPYDQ